MPSYFTILTRLGEALEATSKAEETPINFKYIAVGDGNGAATTPSAEMRSLLREVWRGELNDLYKDPANPDTWIAEVVIPESAGGFTIREVGLFTAENIMYLVGNTPETVKPVLSEGAAKSLYIRLPVKISSEANVQILVDPAQVLATRQWTELTIEQHNTDPDAHEDIRREVDETEAALSAHAGQTDVHAATPAPTASRIIIRDAAGRAQVAAPAAAADIARKDTVDAAEARLQAAKVSKSGGTMTGQLVIDADSDLTVGNADQSLNMLTLRQLGDGASGITFLRSTVAHAKFGLSSIGNYLSWRGHQHGDGVERRILDESDAVSAPTAGRVILRDAAGRAQVAAPAAANDIARKADVDAVKVGNPVITTAKITGCRWDAFDPAVFVSLFGAGWLAKPNIYRCVQGVADDASGFLASWRFAGDVQLWFDVVFPNIPIITIQDNNSPIILRAFGASSIPAGNTYDLRDWFAAYTGILSDPRNITSATVSVGTTILEWVRSLKQTTLAFADSSSPFATVSDGPPDLGGEGKYFFVEKALPNRIAVTIRGNTTGRIFTRRINEGAWADAEWRQIAFTDECIPLNNIAAATGGILPIARGGTGSNTAAGALSALGGLQKNAVNSTGTGGSATVLQYTTTASVGVGNATQGPLEIRSIPSGTDTTGAACITFHRSGVSRANFGLAKGANRLAWSNNSDAAGIEKYLLDTLTGAPMPTTAASVGQWARVQGTATAVSIPAGGTWVWIVFRDVSGSTPAYFTPSSHISTGINAGGTTLTPPGNGTGNCVMICWRIA